MRHSFFLLLVIFFHSLLTAHGQGEDSSICIETDYQFPSRIEDIAVEIDLEVSLDGSMLAVVLQDGVYIFDIPTLKLLKHIEKGSHEFKISWSPDSERFALASYVFGLDTIQPSSQLQIRNLEEVLFSANTETDYVAWSPDGKSLASNQINNGVGGLVIWDVDNLEPVTKLDTGLLEQIVWLPDSSGLIAVRIPQTKFLLWKQESGLEEVNIDNITYTASHIYNSQAAFVIGFNEVKLWNIETKEITAVLQAPTGNIFTAEWSLDGASIAFGTRNGLVIWHPPETEAISDYRDITPPTYQIAWQPDGKALFFSDFDGSIYKWEIESQCVTGKIDMMGNE